MMDWEQSGTLVGWLKKWEATREHLYYFIWYVYIYRWFFLHSPTLSRFFFFSCCHCLLRHFILCRTAHAAHTRTANARNIIYTGIFHMQRWYDIDRVYTQIIHWYIYVFVLVEYQYLSYKIRIVSMTNLWPCFHIRMKLKEPFMKLSGLFERKNRILRSFLLNWIYISIYSHNDDVVCGLACFVCLDACPYHLWSYCCASVLPVCLGGIEFS